MNEGAFEYFIVISALAVKRNSRILACSPAILDHVANQIIPHCKSHASVLMLMPWTSKTLITDRGPPTFGEGIFPKQVISSVAHMENYRLPVTIRYLLQIWRKFRKIEFKPLVRLKWLLSVYWLCPFLRFRLPLSKLLSVWNNADFYGFLMDFSCAATNPRIISLLSSLFFELLLGDASSSLSLVHLVTWSFIPRVTWACQAGTTCGACHHGTPRIKTNTRATRHETNRFLMIGARW